MRETKDEYDIEVERVSRMIQSNNYFDFDFNPKGSGSQHNYKFLDDNTIEDKVSNLIWQRDGSESMLNIDRTIEYINELNHSKHAGFNDWRLPTLKEALTLMEPERNNLGYFIDPIFNEHQFCIWTSDTFKFDDQTYAWSVNFVTGGCFDHDITSNCCVRAVR
jgi:hypothetical protein